MEGDLFASVIPTVEVELFEAQRYRPTGQSQWSSDYLMPTERKRYRVRHSNISWTVLTEAETELLPLGWTWDHQAWRPQQQPDQLADADGWIYGTAWNVNFDGAAEPGRTCMVRWRRIVRLQTFAGTAAFMHAVGEARDTEGCPNVDLDTMTTFSRQLLEALAMASMRCEWSKPQLVKMKSALVEKLREQKPNQVRSIKFVLDEFIEAQGGIIHQANRARPSWLGGGGAVDTGSQWQQEEIAGRMEELEANFPLVEREVLAAFAMRRLCPELTCRAPDGQDSEHDCAFRQSLCPNRGCCERISQRNAKAHAKVCAFKCVPCERCGEEIMRKEMAAHVAAACPDRPISCCFAPIGCTTELSHRIFERHLEDCTQAHLMLLMRTVQDQQQQIKDLVQEVQVDKETYARARENDRKQLGEIALTVSSMRAKLDKQGDFATEITALQTSVRQLEVSMRRR